MPQDDSVSCLMGKGLRSRLRKDIPVAWLDGHLEISPVSRRILSRTAYFAPITDLTGGSVKVVVRYASNYFIHQLGSSSRSAIRDDV